MFASASACASSKIPFWISATCVLFRFEFVIGNSTSPSSSSPIVAAGAPPSTPSTPSAAAAAASSAASSAAAAATLAAAASSAALAPFSSSPPSNDVPRGATSTPPPSSPPSSAPPPFDSPFSLAAAAAASLSLSRFKERGKSSPAAAAVDGDVGTISVSCSVSSWFFTALPRKHPPLPSFSFSGVFCGKADMLSPLRTLSWASAFALASSLNPCSSSSRASFAACFSLNRSSFRSRALSFLASFASTKWSCRIFFCATRIIFTNSAGMIWNARVKHSRSKYFPTDSPCLLPPCFPPPNSFAAPSSSNKFPVTAFPNFMLMTSVTLGSMMAGKSNVTSPITEGTNCFFSAALLNHGRTPNACSGWPCSPGTVTSSVAKMVVTTSPTPGTWTLVFCKCRGARSVPITHSMRSPFNSPGASVSTTAFSTNGSSSCSNSDKSWKSFTTGFGANAMAWYHTRCLLKSS
mmetsp:Transcript_34276/g.62707  ORF Transcript_34276/g.62707 Transcript_34276/m.62707 type:complete len:464 (-) Transcript_34276:1103-2494(-)